MVDVIDWLLSLTGQLESWILGFADAWWVHLVVLLFAAFDGFFPSVPSESTIVTLSSLWSTAGSPSIILIGLAAWLGSLGRRQHRLPDRQQDRMGALQVPA